ncbi:MAG: transporter substrate-binding domain-containing protein [bacterium]
MNPRPNRIVHAVAIGITLIGCCMFAVPGSVAAADDSSGQPTPIRLELTPQEQAWLDGHPVIRVSGPRSFPPFHYFEADGTLKGMAQDYMEHLATMIGVKLEIQRNLPWPEVLRRIQSRELDVISSVAYSEVREKTMAYTRPYLSFPMVIVTRRDDSFVGGLDDLHNKRIACIRSAVTCAWLTRDGVRYLEHPVGTPLEGLESVSLGKADVYLGNLASITYQIDKQGLANLRIAAPTPYGNYNLYMGVRKDWPELVGIFNRALAAMTPEQHAAIRNRWMRVEYDFGIHLRDVIRWGSLAAGIAILLLGTIVIWNRKLRREIVNRERVTEALKSERDFSTAVLGWIHSIVVVVDANGHIVLFNRAAEERSGYSFGEVRQRPFWEILILPEEQAAVWEGVQKAFSEKTTTTSVNFWRTKSGEKRLIQWFNSPLLKSDGSLDHVLATGHDITDRKQAEEAQNENRERLALALEATGASVWEWNLKTNEIDISEELFLSLGYEKDQLTLNPEGLREIVDEATYTEFEKLIGLHNEGKSPTHTIEARVRARNGEWHWIRSQTRVYQWDSENRPEILIGNLIDITESKKTSEVMIQTEKMLSVGGLAAGMAHELNNPLGAILMGIQNITRRLEPGTEKNSLLAGKHGINLEALQGYLEEQKILKSFDGIREAGLRAANIIANMLQFSRASNSQFEPVDLADLIEKTLELAENDFSLKKRLDFKQIDVVREFDGNLPPVNCTETEIKQVILNLIINAFQAMADETRQGKHQLVLRTYREKSFAVIEIEDNGPGMEEGVRKRIFEPFFTTKPVGYGTGLGLSVSYMIVTNNHKGTMTVESIPGQGARFIIRLPFGTG